MKTRSKLLLLASGLILLVGIGFALVLRGSPSERIAHEQGVSVPASASNIQSGGDAWKRWLIDCGATGTFEIPATDLPAFIGSLTNRQTAVGTGDTIVPGNPQYAVTAPWASGSPDYSYACSSPTGDFLRFFDGEDVESSFVQGGSPSLHGLELTRRILPHRGRSACGCGVQRFRIFGTAGARKRWAWGMPEPRSGRHHSRKAGVTWLPAALMKASGMWRVLPATFWSGTRS